MELLDRSLRTNFLCMPPMAVARSCSGGVAILYVLPVLWMTSRLAVLGRMAGVAIPGRKPDVYECLVLIVIGCWIIFGLFLDYLYLLYSFIYCVFAIFV